MHSLLYLALYSPRKFSPNIKHITYSYVAGYGDHGERLVAGIVPLSENKERVLLIQSTRRNCWVLPKGGWEIDEATAEDAARREAWEEAGVVCVIEKDLGMIPDKREPSEITPQAPKAVFHFFEAIVEKEEDDWPEKHKRARSWMTYAQAAELLVDRPELLDALERSSIQK